MAGRSTIAPPGTPPIGSGSRMVGELRSEETRRMEPGTASSRRRVAAAATPVIVAAGAVVATLALVVGVVAVARDPGSRPRPARPSPSTRSGRSPGAGTRRSSTPSGARSRRPPSTPGTCSTRRPRCGTPGRPTTRTPPGYLVTEKHAAADVAAARNEAISYAAYRRPERALHQGRRRLATRCPSSPTSWTPCATRSTSRRPRATARPRSATGSRRRSSAYGLTDGSNEDGGYAATDYKPVEPAAGGRRPRHQRWSTRTAGSRSRSST